MYWIRKARRDDVDVIARIWHSAWEDGHLGHVPPGLLPYRTAEHFVWRTRERLGDIWVAQSRDGIAGFVIVKADELAQLFVDRPARGTGVAAMLLRRGEAEIRAAGYQRAWLAVVAGNQRARSFYARLGWRDAGEFVYQADTVAGPFPVPCHRYEIDLADPATDDPARR